MCRWLASILAIVRTAHLFGFLKFIYLTASGLSCIMQIFLYRTNLLHTGLVAPWHVGF